jgi:probable HAF family extracellular repeat protein
MFLINDPLGTTQPNGINNSGQIVGVYYDGSYHGFSFANGNYTTLGILAYGVNNSGQVVGGVAGGGTYYDGINDQGQTVGFMYTNHTSNGIYYGPTQAWVYPTIRWDRPSPMVSTTPDRLLAGTMCTLAVDRPKSTVSFT